MPASSSVGASQIWQVQRARDQAQCQVVLQGNDVEEAGVRLLFRIVRTATLGAVRAEEVQWSAVERLHAVVVVVPNRAAVALEVDASGAVDCQH